MDWWVIGLAVVVGAVALGWAATADRRRARLSAEAAVSPPERRIPTLDADAPAPAYVTEAAALTPGAASPVGDLDVLSAAVATASELAGGWADAAFVTVASRRWAVVRDPLVLVCTGVGSFRELLPAVEAAKKAGRGLVVVAPAIEAVTVRTLAANAVQGHLPCVAVECGGMPAAAAAAAAAGATVVNRADLQSGWLPAASLGMCAAWVSGKKNSWAVATLDLEPKPERST